MQEHLDRRESRKPSGTEVAAFRRALRTLTDGGIEFVVAGAYALRHYTGVTRWAHDLDAFMPQDQVQPALNLLEQAGLPGRILFPQWLAKIAQNGYEIDLIFGQGNWLTTVDRAWVERGEPGGLFGVPVKFAPVEDMIWSKAYVALDHRYDGADVMHLLEARSDRLDWRHLIDRFAGHWELLFSYLMLFRFVYPSRRDSVPEWVIRELSGRAERQLAEPQPTDPVCRGTLLDRFNFFVDVDEWGYRDGREPYVHARGYSAETLEREWELTRRQLQEGR